MHKKFFVLVLCIMVLACSCAANAEGLKIGILSRSKKIFNTKSNLESTWLWSLMGQEHGENDEYINLKICPA